jgi:hypothetical protein
MFLMNMLTVPKLKDLVNKPNEQYKDIFQSLQHNSPISISHVSSSPGNISPGHSNISLGNNETMANELSTFLNELKKPAPNKTSAGGIMASNEIQPDNGFSSY